MADLPWIALTPEGGVNVYPAAWHLTADGVLSKAPIDLELEPQTLADGSSVAVVDKVLVVKTVAGVARCQVALPEVRVTAVGAGGHYAAVAANDSVLVIDADLCQPVSIVGAESPRAVAIDNTRLATIEGNNSLLMVDWRTWAPLWRTRLPSTCQGFQVDQDGPSIQCNDKRLRLPMGEPIVEAAPTPAATSVVLERGAVGWALWDLGTGERLTVPFGGTRPRAVMDPDHRLAVEFDEPPKGSGAPRTLAAFRIADGAPLWTTTTEAEWNVQVMPGAVQVSSRGVGGARLYDRADGHLVWSWRPDGAGLEGVVIEAGGVSCHAGEPSCPPWTGSAPPLPETPKGVPRVAATTPPPGRAAAARDAAAAGFRDPGSVVDLSRLPTPVVDGPPFQECGAPLSATGLPATVPMRPVAPTLVTVGEDDGYRAPDGMDVLLVAPTNEVMAAMADGEPEKDGSRRVTAFDATDPGEGVFGLHNGQGILISGECKVLARGPVADVVDAAIRWAYNAVDKPLPKRVAATRWAVAAPRYVSGLVAIPGGGVAWSGGGWTGALDATGAALWTHEGKELTLLGDGQLLFESDKGEVRELDPQTGATRRVVPGAQTARTLDGGHLLVDLDGRNQAVLDARTLETLVRFAGGRYTTRLHAGTVAVRWPGIGAGIFQCVRPLDGASRCGASPANAPVSLDNLELSVAGATLTAANKRGKVMWSVAGVALVAPGPRHTAIVQLGSRSGQLALIDKRGRLSTWLPVERRSDPRGFGVAGDSTIVHWEP